MKIWVTLPSISSISFGGIRDILVWFSKPDIIVDTTSFGIPEDDVFSTEWFERTQSNPWHRNQYRWNGSKFLSTEDGSEIPHELKGAHLDRRGPYKYVEMRHMTMPHNNCIKLPDFLGHDHPITEYIWEQVNKFYNYKLGEYMRVLDQKHIEVFYPRFDFILELNINITHEKEEIKKGN